MRGPIDGECCKMLSDDFQARFPRELGNRLVARISILKTDLNPVVTGGGDPFDKRLRRQLVTSPARAEKKQFH